MRTSIVLATFAVLLVALSVSAAPAQQNQDIHGFVDQLKQFWSGFELWLYKLLHGGRNPPGYPGTPVSSSSASASKTVSVRTTSTASAKITTSVSAAVTTTASIVVPTTPTTTSVSSAAATTSVSAVPSATTSVGAEDPLPSKGVSICAAPASQFELSCSAASLASPDTCCNTNPGGHLLLTEFWDAGTASTGPANDWTIHGLWPDNCDGTYEANCDPSRSYSNITAILESYEQFELLDYMKTYWKDGNGDDQSFWEHENSKHGTCISSLEPRCFVNYTPQEEVVYYFRRAVELYKTLKSYDVLAAAGIVPSFTQAYNLADIQNAIIKSHGYAINVQCTKAGYLNELWYHYVGRGSVADGDFIPASMDGFGASSCPATGIKYTPKYQVDPSTPTGTASGATPSSTKAASGFVYAVGADGVVPSGTCLISGGTWYKGGTCAGYTPTTIIGGSVTLTTSKGLCGVNQETKVLSCSAAIDKNTAAQFLVGNDGTLSLGGTTTWNAAQYPSGSTQVPVSKGTGADGTIPLTLKFVAK